MATIPNSPHGIPGSFQQVSEVFQLKSTGGAVKLATAIFLRPSGKNIHRFDGFDESEKWGVRPDFEVALSDNQDDRRRVGLPFETFEDAGRTDRQLKRAVEWLREQL